MALNKKKKAKGAKVKKTPLKKSVKKSAKKTVKKAAAKKVNKKTKSSSRKTAVVKAKKVTTKTSQPLASVARPGARVVQFSKNITPLYDHVIVQQDGESDRTPGGLYIPEIAKDRPARGRVLATGKGRLNKKGALRPLDIKIGESVIYNRYAGSKVTIEGVEYLILRESDVLGVIRD